MVNVSISATMVLKNISAAPFYLAVLAAADLITRK